MPITAAELLVRVSSDTRQAEQGLKSFGDKLSSTAKSMQTTGAMLTAGLTLPLAGVAGAAIKSAANFEQSMNVLQVVSGSTAKEMQALQQQAIQLGAKTSFSAGEAADAMLELGKAGLSSTEIMGAVPGVLNLAAAGNLSVASAAEIAANALNAFQLPAEQAAEVANMLAAAANASSVDVTDLADAFKMSSAVFASNGQSMSDMTTALAILGNNAIKGSDAGTSLKTMMLALSAPTKEAAGVMKDLGLRVYNADGSMRDFQDIVFDLANVTAGLSDQQRNAALSTLFGADAIRAANILVAAGADEWTKMERAVNKAGSSQAAADANMKGLNGAIEYLKGSVDSLLITIGTPFLTGLADVVRSGADALSAFAALSPEVINAALAFGGVLAAIGPAVAILGTLAGALAFVLTPLGAVTVAVGALAAAWAADFMGVRQITINTWMSVKPIMSQWIGWLRTQMPRALDIAQDKVNEVAGIFADFFGGTDVQAFQDQVGQVITGVRTSLADLFNGEISFGDFGDDVRNALTQIPGAISKLFGGTDLSTMITRLQWADIIPKFSWDGVVGTLTWGEFIADVDLESKTVKLGWGDYVVELKWSDFVKTMTGWGTYITATLSDWGTYVVELDWGSYIKTVLAWGDYVSKLWTGYVSKLNWGDYISKLNWDNYATKLDWTLWIPALVWTVVITPVRWASWIPQLLWDNIISKISWSDFITSLTKWDTWVSMLQWTALVFPVFWPAFIEKLGVVQWLAAIGASPQWASFIEKLNWLAVIPGFNWPTWVTSLKWSEFVDELLWPAITAPRWGAFIDKLQWPTIPSFPGWEAIAKGLFGGGGWNSPATSSTGGPTPKRDKSGSSSGGGSTVTPYGGIGLPADLFHASGGLAKGLAVVGENGPELAFFGGSGAEILSHPNSVKFLQSLGLPGFADGTTPAPPLGPRLAPSSGVTARPAGLYPPIGPILNPLAAAAVNMQTAGKVLTESAEDMGASAADIKASSSDFRSALQNVPGLLGTSSVTADQMKMAEMGVPQNFADDYLRRLSDEVINGVNWDNVDIKDAAAAAGIDPNLPAQAILEMFRGAWQDSSLFANPENLKFINQGAVQEAIAKQQASEAGQANLMALFGVGDEELVQQIAGLGLQIQSGLQQSLSEQGMGSIGAQVAAGLGGGIGENGAEMGTGVINGFGTWLTSPDGATATYNMGDSLAGAVNAGFKASLPNYDWTIPVAPPTGGGTGGGTGGAPPGFAGGTLWAPPGLALVGERGPELVRFRGGERVYNADETAARAVQVSMVINASVSQPHDIDLLARRVARAIQQKRG